MHLIGLDVGGTKTLGVRADEKGNIEARVLRPTDASRGLMHVIDCIVEIIQELMPPSGIDAIGVGVPGPINPHKGEVYDPPNLPGWEFVPLQKLLIEKLNLPGVPVALANDANAAALAEYRFGAAPRHTVEDIKHLVYLTVSTGVGGGVITDGKLLLGRDGFAAELGHLIIDFDGPVCGCGNRGCLEAMASGQALARDAAAIVASRRRTLLSDAVGGDPSKMTAIVVEQAARQGDPIAIELMEREGMLVGVGVTSCIHAFNPELVVIGGGLSNAGDLLFKPLRETVRARVMPPYLGTFEIVPAVLGKDVGALGAVATALEKIE